MEAELRNFQVTVFSLCGSGIAPFQGSQVTHYSVCGTGTTEYIPCAEAELQAKEYSMCRSGNAELQVT